MVTIVFTTSIVHHTGGASYYKPAALKWRHKIYPKSILLFIILQEKFVNRFAFKILSADDGGNENERRFKHHFVGLEWSKTFQPNAGMDKTRFSGWPFPALQRNTDNKQTCSARVPSRRADS